MGSMHQPVDGGRAVYSKYADEVYAKHEAKVLRYLEHFPHSPKLLVWDEQDQRLDMEICPGDTLRAYLETHDTLSFAVGQQLVFALESLHTWCVTHGDLHTSNVMLYAPDAYRPMVTVKLIDFEFSNMKAAQSDENYVFDWWSLWLYMQHDWYVIHTRNSTNPTEPWQTDPKKAKEIWRYLCHYQKGGMNIVQRMKRNIEEHGQNNISMPKKLEKLDQAAVASGVMDFDTLKVLVDAIGMITYV
jgi:serine/threonine protein kinase